jgi:hypothetical protein
MFSDTFAGIAPRTVPMFVLMQLVGGLLGYLLIRALYPNTPAIPIPTTPAVAREVATAP